MSYIAGCSIYDDKAKMSTLGWWWFGEEIASYGHLIL